MTCSAGKDATRRAARLCRPQPACAGTERFGRLPRGLSDLRHHDADINADGTVDFGDISPIVGLLTGR